MFFIGFANSLTAARVRFRAEKLTSRHTTLHRRRNNDSDRLRRLDERKILVGNDRMAGRGVAEVMNPVVSKNTNELKTGAPGPFRSSSTRGEPQIWGSEAMSAIRVPRTRRESTVQQRDATLPGGDLDPGTGRTWTRTC